jgi:Domain of unknown function (DUF4440)
MKNLLMIMLLIVCANAYCQTESDKVNQLHNKKFGWLISKNYDSLNWVMDATIKFIHSNGWMQTKKEVIDDLKSGRLNYTAVAVEESSVTLFKNSAVVVGKGNFKGLMPDKSEFSLNLLYTEVYIKSKRHWKLVSRHACKI